jgi:hypothetical protein
MIEFLLLLEKKLPPGFSLELKRGQLGFGVIFKFGRIVHQTAISDIQIRDLSVADAQKVGEQAIKIAVDKIRQHKNFGR